MLNNMSYYHYTSLEALNGILQNDKASKKRLCFWATRYDCFEDKEEYLLGIDCLGKCLSDLEEHYNLQEDRRIAANFKRELIAGKKNLPFPYVVSITSRNDNLYMWENYANHNNGVVLEIDIPQKNYEFREPILYDLEKCIYVESATDKILQKLVDSSYVDTAWMFLSRGRENAIALLKSYPQIFVQFIGVYMLAFFTPRIKRKKFYKEEETRIILSIPPQEYAHFVYSNLGLLQNMFKNLQSNLDVKDIANTIVQEKSRLRANNAACYYRDFYLPKESLLRILTLSNESKIQAGNILQQKGFNSVKVQRLQQKDNNLCNKE